MRQQGVDATVVPRSLVGRARAYSRGPVRMFRANPNMLLGSVILLVFSYFAIFSPILVRSDPTRVNVDALFESPSRQHWFGTDHAGRDVFDRTIMGTRISLLVGFAVAVITNIAGVTIGLLAGYYRKLDNVVMRFMDGLMAFPSILLALALIALLGSSIQNVIIALCVVETPRMVRVVRGSVLSLRDQVFVEAARAIGVPDWRVIFLHVAPNTLAPALVQATFIFALAIIAEANLSFLGAGTPPFIPSWGNIMAEGKSYMQTAFWVTFFPGVALALTVLAINLVGDGLRDALDPKLARRGPGG